MTDEQLVLAAQDGNALAAETILHRFSGYIQAIASDYYLPGADDDDLLQEARIGAYKAIRDWRPDGGSGFKSFLALCVVRNVQTAITTANRGKHRLLAFAIREMENDEGDLVDAVTLIEARELPIPAGVALREELSATASRIRTQLSAFEAHALILFANGFAYAEIGLLLDADEKKIDNALHRARLKLAGPGSDPVSFKGGTRRTVYACPGCDGATIKRKQGRGRPPLCHVCTLRRLAA